MDKKMQELVVSVKSKKQFKGLPDSLVQEIIVRFLVKHKLSLDSMNEKEIKIIKKEVRKSLRSLTGQFQISQKDREKLLTAGEMPLLLKTHSSTSERLDFYPELKEILKRIKVKSILDLGCGLNPLALAKKGIRYYASDIREDELELIKKFFKLNKIKGEVFVQDLANENLYLPKTDICLIFKVLDVIDRRPYEITKRILSRLKSKYILVSFATRKLSGKKMNLPERLWFEKVLDQIGSKYEKFSSNNEVFYLIKNSNS